MSEEAGHDVTAFVEMVRTGVPRGETSRTVTRESGEVPDELEVPIHSEAAVDAIEDDRR